MRVSLVAIGLLLAYGLPVFAQDNKPTVVPDEPPRAQPPSGVGVPLLDQPLRLADFAGMHPRADLKQKLGHVEQFIQQVPNDGQPATESTEVWMGRTNSAIYFAFLCHDSHPEQIRAHLARRENILTDDNVSVLLDTFQDRRRGVLFSVNPTGVQADAAWLENYNADYSYDVVWDSEGHVRQDGWMALIAVPFRTLRFRVINEDWGVVFMRNLPRNSETDYWPRVAANISGTLSQEGTLNGITGVKGSHNLQINPYGLAQNEHDLLTLDPSRPYFSTRNLEATAGGEAKYIIKDSVILDGTINPDFSDVESDQPQFTVNQRYPVYFPELRPFFLENANYFSTSINLVYTRNIIRPEFGARVTGKIDHTNVGFFAIDDREPGQTVAPGDPLYNQRASFMVMRALQDIGKGSSIGVIYTDEEFGGGWNRIGGVDFTALVNKNWTAFGQMVESSTRGTADSGTPPTYSAGPASHLEFERTGHAFNIDSYNQDFSTGFQTDLGFVQTSNIYSDHTHATYQWYPQYGIIQSYGLETRQAVAYDHQGNRLYHNSALDPFVMLPGNVTIAPIGGQNSDTLGPQDGVNLPTDKSFTENFGGITVKGAPLSKFNLNIVALYGGNVNYNPPFKKEPFLMNQDDVQALITVQPLFRLTADSTYLLDRDINRRTNILVYESQVFRTKLNYQFTASISARLIVQYNSTLANPEETSLQRSKQVGTQALFTWLPHPGTAIYFGYNNDIQNLARTLCGSSGVCNNNNVTELPRSQQYLNDGRQFFLKVSYLFRF